jgi:hypothetical protein
MPGAETMPDGRMPQSGTVMTLPQQATGVAPAKRPHNHQPSVIRIATGDEEEDIFRLCRELHDENGYYFKFSEAKVRENLRRAFNKRGAMIPVIGPKGAIEALGYVSIEQFAWSDDWHLSEWFNYVLPDFRRSQHAKTLLQWEKGAADQMGIVLFIGVVSNIRLAAKLRLYRRILGAEGEYGQPGKDVDKFLHACGCAGGYFVYRPKTLYSGPVAENASPH